MPRAGTPVMIAKSKVNGSGEAIHNWKSDHKAAMRPMTTATRGECWRPVYSISSKV